MPGAVIHFEAVTSSTQLRTSTPTIMRPRILEIVYFFPLLDLIIFAQILKHTLQILLQTFLITHPEFALLLYNLIATFL